MHRWISAHGLALAAALSAALLALAAMAELGPLRALVTPFDAEGRPAGTLKGGFVLTLGLPASSSEASVDRLADTLVEAGLRARVDARAEARQIDLVLEGADEAERAALDRSVGGRQVRFAIVPVVSDGEPLPVALTRFARERPDLGVTAQPGCLSAASRAAVDTFVAGAARECPACALADGEAVVPDVSQRVDEYGVVLGEEWCLLVVRRDESSISERDVVDARATTDEYSGRPQVLVTMTPDGGDRFARLTREHIEERLAIVVDGEVRSAPVVKGEIHGGTMLISMGSGPARELFDQARALASTLAFKGAELPEGTSRAWSSFGPASASAVMIARTLTTLLAFIATLALAFVARVTLRLERAPTMELLGQEGTVGVFAAAQRLGLTLVLAAVPFALERVPLPLFESAPEGPTMGNVTTLGLINVAFAYLVVAAVVALVPRWKRLRGGTLSARRALRLATIVVATLLLVLQGIGVAAYINAFQEVPLGFGPLMLVALVLVLGTMALWAAASAITRFGIGNGIALMISVSAIVGVVRTADEMRPSIVTLLVALGGIALLLTLHRVPGTAPKRTPLGGFVAIDLGLTALWFVNVVRAFAPSVGVLAELPSSLEMALPAGVALAAAWLMARPMELARFVPNALVTVALVLAVTHTPPLHTDPSSPTSITQVMSLILAVVVIADVAAEVLAWVRHGPFVRVASTSSVDGAGAQLAVLAAAGVPAVLRAVRLRALLRFMGPWSPIEIMVAAEHRERAEVLMREHAEAAVVQAF